MSENFDTMNRDKADIKTLLKENIRIKRMNELQTKVKQLELRTKGQTCELRGAWCTRVNEESKKIIAVILEKLSASIQ